MVLPLPSHTQALLRMDETSSFIGVYIRMYDHNGKTCVELCLKPMLFQTSIEALQKVAFLNQENVCGAADVFDPTGFLLGEYQWRSMPSSYYTETVIPAKMLIKRGRDVIDIYLHGSPPDHVRTFGNFGRYRVF